MAIFRYKKGAYHCLSFILSLELSLNTIEVFVLSSVLYYNGHLLVQDKVSPFTVEFISVHTVHQVPIYK